ncbi:hypothetical protein LCGC14_1710430 [marine sediment metagenome]|uniref:Uncharacterized protein n=1 Tax=marine sediment metagenome TaxID=412755 RepID=A0A0F9JVW8_9ZZZZ
MVAVIDSFLASATPYVEQIIGLLGMIIQLVLILAVIGYGASLLMYDTKVNVREYSKGGRMITYTTRARRFKDKKTGAPKLKFFGMLGFRGEVINEPPAECLIAFKSRITHKMYDFIKKDGLYYPVNNFVLGIRKEAMQEVEKEFIHPKTKKKFTQTVKELVSFYTLEGSGLEINRDYNIEQELQNTLIEKATTYRNKKPTEIIAAYALMIITIIVSGIVMWYAWKQFGNIAGAIASLGPPLKEGIIGAAQGIIGPG